MTTIAAVRGAGGTFIGCDSAYGWGEYGGTLKEHEAKIVEWPGLAIGAAGDLRMILALRHHFEPPERGEGEDAAAYVARKIAPALRELFEGQKIAWGKEAFEAHGDFEMILVCDGRLFMGGCEFAFFEEERRAAIGSGGQYALGAFDALRPWEHGSMLAVPGDEPGAYKGLRRVLEIAAKNNPDTRPPFIIKEQQAP